MKFKQYKELTRKDRNIPSQRFFFFIISTTNIEVVGFGFYFTDKYTTITAMSQQ